MTLGQRIVLILAGILLFLGSVMILFSDGSTFFEFIEFYMMIGVPATLFYYAFSSSQKEREPPQPKTNSKAPQQSEEPIPIYENNPRNFLEKAQDELQKNQETPQSQTNDPTLLKISSVFPFQLFPDVMIIDQRSITIIRKNFFGVATTETIALQDMGNVDVFSGPIFASIGINAKYTESEVEMKNLWKSDALKAKKVIDGLLMQKDKLAKVPQDVPAVEKEHIAEKIGTNPQVEQELRSIL